jgi:molecular chaperone GrpE
MTEPNTAAEGAQAAGGDGASAGVGDEREALRAQLAAAEAEREQFRALLQRTRADFENYQKRVQRDQAQERKYAHGDLARELLPALDNLERATAAAKQAGETGPLVQGVALVETQLLDLLRRHGITRIAALGQPFDPHLHHAVMRQPSAVAPPNTVVQVLEQGYMLHDRVLRPAGVAVAVPPEPGQA